MSTGHSPLNIKCEKLVNGTYAKLAEANVENMA